MFGTNIEKSNVSGDEVGGNEEASETTDDSE
jgi:hypothetical protein